MLEALPKPNRKLLLKTSPLRQVALSVTWPAERALRAEEGVKLRNALRDHPQLQTAEIIPVMLQTNVVSGAGIPSPEPVRASGWQINGGAFTVSIYAHSAIVEDNAYESWATFVDRARPALKAVQELMGVKVCARIMSRYQNYFIDENAVTWTAWRKKIRAPYLAVGEIDELGGALAGSLTMFTLQEGNDDVQVRSGLTRDEGMGCVIYLLDIEANHRGVDEFDVERIVEVGDEQNMQCLRVFESAVEPAFLKKLRGRA